MAAIAEGHAPDAGDTGLPGAPSPLTTPRTALLVAAGGAAGSAARHVVELAVPSTLTPTLVEIPWSTWTVNVLGCLAIGLIAGVLEVRRGAPSWIRPLLVVGFCGGFTTMSTVVLQISAMVGAEFPLEALEYGAGTLLASILATAAGIIAGRTLSGRERRA